MYNQEKKFKLKNFFNENTFIIYIYNIRISVRNQL